MSSPAIQFVLKQANLQLVYKPYNDDRWIIRKLQEEQRVTIRRTFTFLPGDVLERPGRDDGGKWRFNFGTLDASGYVVVDKRILSTQHDTLIHKDVELVVSMFTTIVCSVSLIPRIEKLLGSQVVIGGPKDGAIHGEAIRELARLFPTAYWVRFYIESQTERILSEFCEVRGRAEERFDKYIRKKYNQVRAISLVKPHDDDALNLYDLNKFEYLKEEFKKALDEAGQYQNLEDDWSKRIMEFILQLYPKYVCALYRVGVPYKDENGEGKRKQLDIALVDASGVIDIIEIKRPVQDDIFSKGEYRNNKYPGHTLSGTVMQMETYLHYLTKGGDRVEDYLNQHNAKRLPTGLRIKVINPKGILIIGRSDKFTTKEKFAFEIIRRKYARIIDILTYDDILRRMENIITALRASKSIHDGEHENSRIE